MDFHEMQYKMFQMVIKSIIFNETLFSIFLFNSIDFQAKTDQSAFLEQFNDIVIDVPAEDMYYLLQTFASMALARELNDIEFIRRVATDLFQVNFWKPKINFSKIKKLI